MSVILKDLQTGKILILTKGADSVIEELLSPGQEFTLISVMQFVEDYANSGLRTLLLAQKEISQSDYDKWSHEYKVASTCLEKREESLASLYCKIEQDLHLVGSTAIEDKL